MKIIILTLFPNELGNFFLKGIFGRAQKKSLVNISFINLRDFCVDKYKKVDDYPFGKKLGMVLKVNVITNAIRSIAHFERYRIIYPCPKGKIFTQGMANALLNTEGLIIIPGYYEGIDQRIFELFNIETISIGDYILSSGELPSLVITEAVIRMLPGVVGKEESVKEDSIITNLLEYPLYTQPREYEGYMVPEELLSGNHKLIENWKKTKALELTLKKRPDLLKNYQAGKSEKKIIVDILTKCERGE